eukprot:5551868-Pleurochrysis_carterae.AAC.1
MQTWFGKMRRLLPVVLLALPPHVLGASNVRWSVVTTQQIPSSKIFQSWFTTSEDALPAVVRSSNIDAVQMLEDGIVRGLVTSNGFPFVKLETQMVFSVTRNGEGGVETRLVDQDTQVHGPELLCKIVRAASNGMQTSSTTIVRCHEDSDDETEVGEVVLEVSTETEVQLSLPSWIPLPAEKIREGGQKAIEKQINTDLQSMLQRLSVYGENAAAQ